jgi:hypothetical protein
VAASRERDTSGRTELDPILASRGDNEQKASDAPEPFVTHTVIMVRLRNFYRWPYSRHIFHVIVAVTLLVYGRVALAGEIQIEGSRCSSEIRLGVREMRLSDVLAQLVEYLIFSSTSVRTMIQSSPPI